MTRVFCPQAALCRSSQPLSGFSARCEEDEQLLDCILRSNPNTSHMIVVDTRPKVMTDMMVVVLLEVVVLNGVLVVVVVLMVVVVLVVVKVVVS